MPKFRKRPVIVTAHQWQPGAEVPGVVFDTAFDTQDGRTIQLHPYVITIHGQRSYIEAGDWVITEPDGFHHYPCKPDIFAATYEPIEEPSADEPLPLKTLIGPIAMAHRQPLEYPVIGVTGTRDGGTPVQLAELTNELRRLQQAFGARELHHGCCTGVDTQVHWIARKLGFRIVGHPGLGGPSDPLVLDDCDLLLPAKPYLARNRDIVSAAHLLLVVPKEAEEQLRSGTWATYRYALEHKLPIVLFYPVAPPERSSGDW